MVYETGVIGFITGLVAIPLGILLSTLLAKVINVRSFGWSMVTRIDLGLVADAMMLALFSALVAGFLTGLRWFGFQYGQSLHND